MTKKVGLTSWPRLLGVVVALWLLSLVEGSSVAPPLPWPLLHRAAVPLASSRVFNVAAMGAKADNRTDNSPVFAAALRLLAQAGSGTLLVPAGGIYLTLPLNLTTSGTRLRIEAGATVKALCDAERWPKIATLPSYGTPRAGRWLAPFIGASDVHDIILDGGGTVDSSGQCFWGGHSTISGSRGNLLLFERVARAELSGLLFTNSPFWTLHLWDSEDLHVHGIRVHNPASSDNEALFFGPNTDGIDIDSSRRVLLEDSHFHAGDDCVVLKSGKDAAGRSFGKPSANILIRNLTLEACSCFKHSSGGLHHDGLHWYDGCGGLKVGTEMSGGVENVTLEDTHIIYAGSALKMLSPKGRGGYIRNVTWQRITVDESGGLLWLQVSNSSADPAENALVDDVSVVNVTLKNLSCHFHTAAHPQRDCEAVGVLDLDSNMPAVSMYLKGIEVLAGGQGGWSCTGPPARLTAPATWVRPPLPPSCAHRPFEPPPQIPRLLTDDTAVPGSRTQASPHTLRLGFNVGYLSDSQYYERAFRRIAADGILHTRFMGPFLHSQGHAAERRENFTSALLANVSKLMGDSSTITLSLSDFPFDVVPDLLEHPSRYLSVWPKPWQAGVPANATLAATLRYTNRAPPTRGAWAGNATLPDYLAILRRLRGLLGPSVDFEIANEPNALSYFWGDAADFGPIADGILSALADPSLPASLSRVTCCAFATELSCQGIQEGSDNGFTALAQQVTARHARAAAGRFETALSWHFYRRVSHDSDPARSTFANATKFYGRAALRNSVLSEWGLSTFNSAESAARINSPELVLELVRVLAFAAEVGLAELDAHCLMDNPHKAGHDCFFDRWGEPRASYFHYALVARVIRGGYTVSGGRQRLTNISGVSSGLEIIAAAGDPDGHGATEAPFTLPPGYGIIAASSASGFASGGKMLRAGEWVVIQAEPTRSLTERQSPEQLAAKTDDVGAPPIVQTTDGRVRGLYRGASRMFLGIPFAAPPIDRLRFALPISPARWNHTLDATQLRDRCIQDATKGNFEQRQSEDCLHLNVFTPRNHSAASMAALPVMVYIHGGGQQSGCSADFYGDNLAEYAGMVVVVIQYRLNVFGYFVNDEMLANGASNLGLLDQVQALKWVQHNIQAFGGDPTSVLVSGQSSGCSSVGFHLVYPQSWPLYARAAMMSCAMNDWQPKSSLLAHGTEVTRTLGCDSADPGTVLSCLRAAKASAVFDALVHSKGAKFDPCYNCLQIPVHPLVLMKEGKVSPNADVMLGNVRYEHGTVAALHAFGFPNSSTITAQQYATAVDKLVHSANQSGCFRNASMVTGAMQRYAPLVDRLGYWYALATMSAHSNVVCSQHYQSQWLATALSQDDTRDSKLYRYVFTHVTLDWPAKPERGIAGRVLNATHTAALPYLFKNASVLSWFLGYGSLTPQERTLSDQIATAWSRFACNGDPGVSDWQQYDRSSNFTFVLDSSSPKAIADGAAWHDEIEPYCSFWERRYISPFPDERNVSDTLSATPMKTGDHMAGPPLKTDDGDLLLPYGIWPLPSSINCIKTPVRQTMGQAK